MPRCKASRLTLLPYDLLHQILSLVLPSLPPTVHLNLDPFPSYLRLFRAAETIQCPPVLLVCRLLSRLALRIVYAQTRIVIHPSRPFLTRLSALRARKHVQRIDLAVPLRPRVPPKSGRDACTRSSVDLQLESFYSPSYVVDFILRTFPKLGSIHLTIIETDSPTERDSVSPKWAGTRRQSEHEVLHQFPPPSLTQSSAIDTLTWNNLITSLRYKTCQTFTELSLQDLKKPPSPSPWPPFPAPSRRPLFTFQGRDILQTNNDHWRDRTRRLMEVASRSTNTTSPIEQSSVWPLANTIADSSHGPANHSAELLDTGESVTDFVLQDDFPEGTNDGQDENNVAEGDESLSSFTQALQERAIAQGLALSLQQPPHLVLPREEDEVEEEEEEEEEEEDLFRRHILARFSPFAPPTLPNLQSVEFYVTTEQSNKKVQRSPGAGRWGPGNGVVSIGRDGDVLRPKFEVLLSNDLFGGVRNVKVRRVVEETDEAASGWEELHEADLARMFASRNELVKGKGKGKRRQGLFSRR